MTIRARTSLTTYDASPLHETGVVFRDETNGKEYMYLQIESSATAAEVLSGACSIGEPGIINYEDGKIAFFGGITGKNYKAGKMGLALGTGAVSEYGWFQTKGVMSAAVKSAGAFTKWARVVFASISNTGTRKIFIIADGIVSASAKAQGYCNAVASTAQATVSVTLYGF